MLPTRPDGPVGSMRESRFGQSLGWDFFCYSCSTPVSRKPGPDNERSSADVSAGDESDVRCVRSQASLAVILLEPHPPKAWSGQPHKEVTLLTHPPSLPPRLTKAACQPRATRHRVPSSALARANVDTVRLLDHLLSSSRLRISGAGYHARPS